MKKVATSPLAIEVVPTSSLQPDPTNPRRISDQELEALTRSIKEFGLVDPVIARRETRVVIGGHQRLLAARKLGLVTVPVVFLDVSEARARLLGIALNKISGEFEEELLGRLLAELASVSDLDLTLSGEPPRFRWRLTYLSAVRSDHRIAGARANPKHARLQLL